jgi:hypothetical protein
MKRHRLDWVAVCLSSRCSAYLVWKEGLATIRTILFSLEYHGSPSPWRACGGVLSESAVLVVIRRRYKHDASYASCFRSTLIGYLFVRSTASDRHIASQITVLSKDRMKVGDAATYC